MVNVWNLIDKTVPILPLCVINNCLGVQPTYVEIIFGILDIFFRTMHGTMFLLVNFTPVTVSTSEEIIFERLERNKIFGSSFLFKYKTITWGLHYISRMIAAVVLIYGAVHESMFYLRVWVKITMMLFIFLITDVGYVIASSIIIRDAILPLMAIIELSILVPTYISMAALVNTHWRTLMYKYVRSHSSVTHLPRQGFRAESKLPRKTTLAKEPNRLFTNSNKPPTTSTPPNGPVQGVLKKPKNVPQPIETFPPLSDTKGNELEWVTEERFNKFEINPTDGKKVKNANLPLQHPLEIVEGESRRHEKPQRNLQDVQRDGTISADTVQTGKINKDVTPLSPGDTDSSGTSGVKLPNIKLSKMPESEEGASEEYAYARTTLADRTPTPERTSDMLRTSESVSSRKSAPPAEETPTEGAEEVTNESPKSLIRQGSHASAGSHKQSRTKSKTPKPDRSSTDSAETVIEPDILSVSVTSTEPSLASSSNPRTIAHPYYRSGDPFRSNTTLRSNTRESLPLNRNIREGERADSSDSMSTSINKSNPPPEPKGPQDDR